MDRIGAYEAKTHLPRLLDRARRHELPVYDAAYLEVALRRSLPLAILNRHLRDAANVVGVSTVNQTAT